MSPGEGTAGRLETHLVESRRHPPDPAFAAQANVGLDVAARAAADPVAFWEAQAHRLQWDAPWHTALDWRPATPGPDGELSVPAARWFDGGRLNAAVNCLDRHVRAGRGERTALFFEGERAGLMREMIEFRPDLLLPIFLIVAIGFVILTLPVGLLTTRFSSRLSVKR